MLIFSVSFQFERMIPEGNPQQRVGPTIPMLMTTATTIVMVVTTGDNDKVKWMEPYHFDYTSNFIWLDIRHTRTSNDKSLTLRSRIPCGPRLRSLPAPGVSA